jgi:hypothetical protein
MQLVKLCISTSNLARKTQKKGSNTPNIPSSVSIYANQIMYFYKILARKKPKKWFKTPLNISKIIIMQLVKLCIATSNLARKTQKKGSNTPNIPSSVSIYVNQIMYFYKILARKKPKKWFKTP